MSPCNEGFCKPVEKLRIVDNKCITVTTNYKKSVIIKTHAKKYYVSQNNKGSDSND